MENLILVFVEEATELLEDLERALLKLESNHEHKEGISEVFRTMHSLKGTAGMFGFEAIATLTHGLETIYQSIREGECSLTPEIFRTTLQCLDHLRDILNDPRLTNPALAETHEKLAANISNLSNTTVHSDILYFF
jgi:two-component system, chemotaxis family, sensor kinase CheA